MQTILIKFTETVINLKFLKIGFSNQDQEYSQEWLVNMRSYLNIIVKVFIYFLKISTCIVFKHAIFAGFQMWLKFVSFRMRPAFGRNLDASELRPHFACGRASFGSWMRLGSGLQQS